MLGILFIILSNIGGVYIPILLRNSIDELKNNLDFNLVIKNTILVVVTSAVAGVFRFMIRQTIIVVSREIEFDLRQDFWQHIQKLPLRFFQNNSTGNIMAHATSDISAVRMFVGPAVMYSTDTGMRFFLILPIMLWMNTTLTLFALLPLPLLSFAVYLVMKKIHVRYTKIQEKFSDLTTKAQENFSGIRVVKSYLREDFEISQFEKESNEYLKRNMDLVKVRSLFQPIFYLIAGLSSIIVLWKGGTMIMNNQLSLGTMFAFLTYLLMLIWPMIAFGWVANMIQQADASMKRLLKIFNEPYEISDSEKTDFNIKTIDGEIEFRNVKFRYRENLPLVLNDISLKIPKGSTVAFIGNTGVGKTSLINLIARLYDVTEGEVLIDGKNVKSIPLEVVRKNIGLVPQDSFLFSDTLANNLMYGVSNPSQELIDFVSEVSQLKKDVESFPNGFETILGERGITLSGGQKQRASLARALAINPKILILDDSFSAVDTHTEEEILKRLKSFMKDRTSIIISHRISTVKDCDKIFVLENGKIAEEGNHDELIELNGIYADLHNKQLLEEELSELN
ncbi:ABC transporter ATP-binding protein [Stygiobacter electus]|uniref:ABC transporter ATP-binding protein n=1 Tax=Stygiobacter electus TaxID=3032292 RepID=A0AAE3NYY8_9BACT|nr:ABC transporter ATP-binding protein [Stygiobacter electus]MDF1611195.1 ABC transporter ATP-binding protein [Stygiobacter electus]